MNAGAIADAVVGYACIVAAIGMVIACVPAYLAGRK